MRGDVLIRPIRARALAAAALVSGCGEAPAPRHAPGDTGAEDAAFRGCDPLRSDGCGPGLRCVAEDRFPLAGRCAAVGDVPLGARCAASGSCVAGTQCIRGRCLRPCEGDDACAGLRGPSRCAVAAASPSWLACTLVGECDDADAASCGAGLVCRATDPTGGGVCSPRGAGGDGAPCQDPDVCDRTTTCFIPAGGSTGACRPLCFGDGDGCARPRRCTAMLDRPIDLRVCVP